MYTQMPNEMDSIQFGLGDRTIERERMTTTSLAAGAVCNCSTTGQQQSTTKINHDNWIGFYRG
jgi:hypothetical protein